MTACPVFVRFDMLEKSRFRPVNTGAKRICPIFRCPVFVRFFYIFATMRYSLRPLASTEPQTPQTFMEPKILLIAEVAALMRVANVTIYRWVIASRSGRGSFPLPISGRKAKLRWLATDIEKYIESQSVLPPEFVSPVKQAKEYERRQEAARAALAKHGINR